MRDIHLPVEGESRRHNRHEENVDLTDFDNVMRYGRRKGR